MAVASCYPDRTPVGDNADSDVRPGGASGSGKRFCGRRFTLLRGLWIVFEDAPVAAVIRALAALAGGAATGPLLVLATERFIATALEVAAGGVAFAAVAAPVLLLLALFAVQILETAVRGLADARIETGLRRGFRTDLTEKRARLEYRYLEHPETADLLRRVASGPQQGVAADAGAGTGQAGVRRLRRAAVGRGAGGRHRGGAGAPGLVDRAGGARGHGAVRAAGDQERATGVRAGAPRVAPAPPRQLPGRGGAAGT